LENNHFRNFQCNPPFSFSASTKCLSRFLFLIRCLGVIHKWYNKVSYTFSVNRFTSGCSDGKSSSRFIEEMIRLVSKHRSFVRISYTFSVQRCTFESSANWLKSLRCVSSNFEMIPIVRLYPSFLELHFHIIWTNLSYQVNSTCFTWQRLTVPWQVEFLQGN